MSIRAELKPSSAERGLLEFVLNSRHIDASGTAPHTTLLDFLRTQGLTGAKEGCAEGECGACTVLLVKARGSGCEYVAVNSCLLFLGALGGQEVYTVEALAQNGALAEAQQAMAAAGGSQCGYCTPGFVMSLFAEQYRPGRTGPCDPHAMAGNLCRCTGYRPIRDAALSLGAAPDDDFRSRLSRPAPEFGFHEHHSNGTSLIRPGDLARCLSTLEEYPEAQVLSGATDLAVDANLKYRRWPMLVSVEAIPELKGFFVAPDFVEIGAGLTLSEIESRWSNAPGVMREWFPLFASPLIRNRATLGGNLATASPIGDAAPMLLALDADVVLASSRGQRVLPLADFFLSYRKTALEPGELIVSIRLPLPLPMHARFFKIAKRREDDISTVAACFAVDWNDEGRVDRIRIALGGVAATPIRIRAAEQALLGQLWNEDAIQEAKTILADSVQPLSDHRGSAEYRLAVAQTLLEKFWVESLEEAAA